MPSFVARGAGSAVTHYEQTPEGEQAVIAGAEGRSVPGSRLRARRAQQGVSGLPLFTGEEPEQAGLFDGCGTSDCPCQACPECEQIECAEGCPRNAGERD